MGATIRSETQPAGPPSRATTRSETQDPWGGGIPDPWMASVEQSKASATPAASSSWAWSRRNNVSNNVDNSWKLYKPETTLAEPAVYSSPAIASSAAPALPAQWSLCSNTENLWHTTQ